MTLKEYIDEVKLRALRYNIHTTANDMLIATYINRGRQYAQQKTLSYLSQKYGAIIRISGNVGTIDALTSVTYSSGYTINSIRYALPADLIDITNVIISNRDTTTTPTTYWRKEARALDAQELTNIYNHSWNIPQFDRPVYSIENIIENNVGNSGKTLILAGLEVGTTPGSTLNLANITLEIWYIRAIQDMNIWTDLEVMLSPDLQELAINHALLNIVRDGADMQAYQSLQQDVNNRTKSISALYQVSKIEQVQELETNE